MIPILFRNMLFSSKVLTFIFGFLIGFIFYRIVFIKSDSNTNLIEEGKRRRNSLIRDVFSEEYNKWLSDNINHKGGSKVYPYFGNDNVDGILESRFLFDKIKVTCIVFVENQKNAYLIHNTWGPKCNSLSFYSKSKDNFIETNVINYTNKWQYLCESLRHLWNNDTDFQWVLISPDDVFVIPENLRYFLATKDYEEPYYYGHNVVFWQQYYNSDKTSFVLSRGAVRIFFNKFNSSSSCSMSSRPLNNAVFNLGKELSVLGIHAGDSRDHLGRDRFHIFTFEQLTSPDHFSVISRNSKTSLHPIRQGKDCCSDTSISFRSVQNDKVYLFSYFLYKVILSTKLDSPKKVTALPDDDKVWIDFVRKELGNVNLSSITNEKYYELWRSKTWEPEEFNRKIREDIMLKIHRFI